MSFTLNNFKSQIDATILQRGRNYYQSGQVIDLEEIGDGMWSAIVSGSEDYDVSIEQLEAENLICDCTCPYDYGPTCKHIAAVLYAIEETFTEYLTNKKASKPRKKRKTKQEKVVDALNNLSKEELVDFLATMAKSDRQLADKVLAQFAHDGIDKAAYARLINSILKSQQDRGFLDYSASRRAGNQIYEIVEQAQQEAKAKRMPNAIALYQAVIESVAPAISHADDSNGDLGDCLMVSLDDLKELVDDLSQTEQDSLFDYCLSEAIKEVYQDWDWGWELTRIAASIVRDETQRFRLYDVLDTMAAHRHADTRFSGTLSNYDTERAELIKLTVIERLDDSDTLKAFLLEKIDIERFRERLIRFYIEADDFVEARRLCNEWIDVLNQDKRGFYSIFTTLLLEIAQKEDKSDEVIALSEKLFLDRGDFAYFDTLKKQILESDWQAFRTQLIRKAQNASHYQSLAPEIYKREAMWDELLDYLKIANRYLVDHYRTHLEPHFPEPMCDIYERIARNILTTKANRKGYRETCHYLRRIQKLGQEDRVEALLAEFRSTYSKRRALLDELSKL